MFSGLRPSWLLLLAIAVCVAIGVAGGRLDEANTEPSAKEWIRVNEVNASIEIGADPKIGRSVTVLARVVRDYREDDLTAHAVVSTLFKVVHKEVVEGKEEIHERMYRGDEVFTGFDGLGAKVSEAFPLFSTVIKGESKFKIDFHDIEISRSDRGSKWYSDLFINKKVFLLVAVKHFQISSANKEDYAKLIALFFLIIGILFTLPKIIKHGQYFSVEVLLSWVGLGISLIHILGLPMYYTEDETYNRYISHFVCSTFAHLFAILFIVQLLVWKPKSSALYQGIVLVVLLINIIFMIIKHATKRNFYMNESPSLKDDHKEESFTPLMNSNKVIHANAFFLYAFSLILTLAIRSPRLRNGHLEALGVAGGLLYHFRRSEAADYRGLLHNSFSGHALEHLLPVLVYVLVLQACAWPGGLLVCAECEMVVVQLGKVEGKRERKEQVENDEEREALAHKPKPNKAR